MFTYFSGIKAVSLEYGALPLVATQPYQANPHNINYVEESEEKSTFTQCLVFSVVCGGLCDSCSQRFLLLYHRLNSKTNFCFITHHWPTL